MWTRGVAALPASPVWRARGIVTVTWSVEEDLSVETTTVSSSAAFSILKMIAV